jgi:nucleotide-binding universal stress UspA family protein
MFKEIDDVIFPVGIILFQKQLMKKILVTTDFSAASTHSLDYTCQLLKGKDVEIELLHIYSVPVNYTSDGIALVAINDAIERATELLDNELERSRQAFPGIRIQGKVHSGHQKDILIEEIATVRPLFVVISTSGYEDIFPGDPDPLDILVSLAAPVFFVPIGAPMIPVRNAAFACNYAYVGPQTPTDEMMNLIRFIDAKLHVVHADPNPEGSDQQQESGKTWLNDQLAPVTPTFHWIQDEDALHGISNFVQSGNADCLIIVPRRFGIWENLFERRQMKALARLNKVPVLAFHNKV